MIARAAGPMIFICLGQSALAQDNGISFELGLGAQSGPEYFGDDDSVIGVTGSFSLERLEFWFLSIDDEEKYGLQPTPSFGIIGARNASDFDELVGLDDIDASIELGGGLEYTAPGYEVYGVLRYGVIGHESLVGEIGGDVILRPTDQITLSAGPRVLWGSDDYAQTYFGVTDAESAESDFDAFEAGAGIVSAGIEAEARYSFNEDWGITGTIRYDQLRDDAADSPITQSEDQVTGSLVITRRITLGF